MHYVEQYGALWKLTERKFHKLKTIVAAGGEYDLDQLGKRVADRVYHPLTEAEAQYNRRNAR